MTAAYVSFHQPATQPEFDAIHHLVAAELELRRCSVIRHGLFLEQMDRADRSARSSILPAAQASMVAAFESLATERSVLSQLTRQQRHFAQEITKWENRLAELRALAPLTGRAQEALLIEHLALPVPTPDPITEPTSEPRPDPTSEPDY